MKAVVLAGGFDQIALIRELKERGAKVILVDYLEKPPAKPYADVHYPISTLNIEDVRRVVNDEKPDLITTACTDQSLLTAAKLSEEFQLPCYISYETARNVTNKTYMKKMMQQAGIPTAEFRIVHDAAMDDALGFQYPIVVKPADCNSSKGVRKVDSMENYVPAVAEALKLSRTGSAVVEAFIFGKEISVDAFVRNGKAEILLMTETRKAGDAQRFTITQSRYPAGVGPSAEGRIGEIAQAIADAFGIADSPLLIQCIVDGNDVEVVEFSARMGGGTKYQLIEVLTGVNIMRAYVDLILGKHPAIDVRKPFNYAHLNYCYAYNGTFSRLDGFEQLKQDGIIHDYFQYKTEGAFIEKAETSSDRVAGYLVTAQDVDELRRKEQIANRSLKILSDRGEDIMRHDWI